MGPEERLRRIPEVDVPEELEMKVLDTIPKTQRMQTSHRTLLIRAAALLLVLSPIAIAVVVFLPIDSRQHEAAATLVADTSTDHVLGISLISNVKETSPCDILPPLHKSYWLW